MTTINLDKQQSVYILSLTNGLLENVLNINVLNEYNAIFDEIERYKKNASLIIQCNHPKTFSNSLDLAWLVQQSIDEKKAFVIQLEKTLIRLALLTLPVLAVINGNAYAGDAILASACDFRFMLEDIGRFCLPKMNINIPFTPVLMEIFQLLPNTHAVQYMTLTGNSLSGAECAVSKIVDQIYPADTLSLKALTFAEEMSIKSRTTYTAIKHQLRTNIVNLAKARGIYDEKKYIYSFDI